MYSEIEANKRKTILLMFGFFVLVGAIAYGVGYFFKDSFSQIVLEISKARHLISILVLVLLGLMISRATDYFFNKE